jgi:hypothetical protein
VLLSAQMKCGKTSVIQHLAYLINILPYEEHAECLGLAGGSDVYVLSHLSDRSLTQQTQLRLAPFM